MDTAGKVSVKNAEHYKWGQNNDGWHLLNRDDLSVIEERMGPGTTEQLHFHKNAQQLFYILSGEAGFETDQTHIHLSGGESLHILPGMAHRISNTGGTDLHFLVISSPPSHGDRIDL